MEKDIIKNEIRIPELICIKVQKKNKIKCQTYIPQNPSNHDDTKTNQPFVPTIQEVHCLYCCAFCSISTKCFPISPAKESTSAIRSDSVLSLSL